MSWIHLNDWNWSQMDGLEGNRKKKVSNKPLLLLVQDWNGDFHSQIINKKAITLQMVADTISKFFKDDRGDQMLEEIEVIKDTPYLTILRLYFDS
jgi:hypothetical protein